MARLFAVLSLLWRYFLLGWRSLFGVWHWDKPDWVNRLGGWFAPRIHYLKGHPWQSISALLLAAGVGGASWYGYHLWESRPQPVTIDFSVAQPERMKIEEKNAKPNPLVITFRGSVAPLDLAGKDIADGVTIKPEVKGRWHWLDDRRLALLPDREWPVGESFEVAFEKHLVAEQIRLTRDEFSFAAPAFTATLGKSEFYQDPLDPALKKAIFQVRFSHPVETASLEKAVEMTLAGAKDTKIRPEPIPFTVSYDKLGLNAFIHSRPLAIPQYPQQVRFLLKKGVKAKGSKAETASELHSEARVPGLYDERMIEAMQLTVAPNLQSGQQEQILVVNTAVPIHEREMAQAVQAWLLPEFHPETPEEERDRPYYWSADQVTADILNTAKRIDLHAIPAENEYGTTHAFRLDADVGRYLYIKVSKELRSFGGYQLPKPVHQTLLVPEFPKELHIMGQGSLLTLSGEKKIAVMTRDLKGLKVELGRLLPDQLQHLVTQTSGDFAHPEFSSHLGQDNLTERFELKLPLPEAGRGKPHYQPIDLKTYLADAEGQPKRGIFLLTAKGYDPAKTQKGETDDSGEPEEKRLMLVTDLGMIVKTELDGSQIVFVQSIQTGEPQEGVEVSVVGKNGLTVMQGQTDADGKVRFAKLAKLEREREPVLYLASDQGDMSFLPLGRDDRNLNFSRFDIGGAANAADPGELSAYLFSDRGIYRPGDAFHIGMIVKAEKWDISLAGLPLEAEILDPRGLVVKKTRLNLGQGGFNELAHETLESSPTGTYTVNLYTVKNAKSDKYLGSVSVKVEEFLPDRMKAAIRFSKPAAEGWLHPKDLQATVNVQNLYGAPAENRTVEAGLTLSPRLPEFPRFKDYRFHDPHFAEQGYDEELNPAQTDASGNAVFNLGLEKYAKATYKLHLLARAFEAKGGRSVAAEADILVSDLPYLVGYKADGGLDFVARDAARHVELIAIDPNLQKTAADKLTLELIERKALSVLMRQDDGTYRYESRIKEISLSKTPFTVPKEGYTLALDSKTPGDYVYQVRNAEGLVLTKIAYSVAGLGNVSRTLDRNAELQLTLDKPSYEPGETITVNIRAPYTGAGLITVERDKVYASRWFRADTQSTVQTIEVPKELTGNGYVSVQFIRDPGSDEIFMSPLSYGVAPFKISLAAHTQPLTIDAPERIKPGERLSIKLTSDGPARVVVFAVDEGILQVARYKNPDPLGHFFRKRQLEVGTAQILDLILPEFKKLLQLSAPGGDGEEEEAASYLNPFKRKRDKPAVYWSGITDIDGEKTFSYDAPETFNGALKIFAVAVGDLKIASVAGKTQVRGDLIITPNVPSMIAPGDEFTVSAGVANHVEGSGAKAEVKVALTVPPQLQIKGASERTITIAEGHESAATFTLQAAAGNKAVLGDAELRFTAANGGKSARLGSHLSLRPAVPKMANLKLGTFEGKQEVAGLRRMHPEYRKVSAGLSPLPLVAMPGLTDFLDNFSHTCTEQLTSRAMPGIVLHKRPEFGDKTDPGSSEAELLKLFSVLRTRQNGEGGFGLWTASPEAHEFVSVYATHMLLEASANGFPVPADMFQHAMDYLKNLSASSSEDLVGLRTRAYAAYLLTRQGNVTTAALTGIREALRANYQEEEWQNDLVAVYLAASYRLLQQPSVADALIKIPAEKLGSFSGEFTFNDYYDPLIHQAETLYVLAKHFPERLKKMPTSLFEAIGKQLQEDRFNTLSSGYLLLAFDAYLDVLPAEIAQSLSISAIDGTGRRNALALPQNFAPRAPFPIGTAALEFEGNSGIPLYYAVSESGFDIEPPKTEVRDGLEIVRSFLDDDGKPLDKIPLGAEVTVSIRARAIDRDFIDNVAVVDLLPGGFEAVVQNPAAKDQTDSEEEDGDNQENFTRWQDRLKTGGNWAADYVDVREDRVLLYGTLSKDMAEYRYRAKATAAGVFNIPPVYAEAMYIPILRAHSGAGTVRVDEKNP
ncbi:MAG: alpha-2-macroglobulin family protein [Methylomicrobium sp.]